jgi:hypothetical protein
MNVLPKPLQGNESPDSRGVCDDLSGDRARASAAIVGAWRGATRRPPGGGPGKACDPMTRVLPSYSLHRPATPARIRPARTVAAVAVAAGLAACGSPSGGTGTTVPDPATARPASTAAATPGNGSAVAGVRPPGPGTPPPSLHSGASALSTGSTGALTGGGQSRSQSGSAARTSPAAVPTAPPPVVLQPALAAGQSAAPTSGGGGGGGGGGAGGAAGGGGTQVDKIRISKCWTNATATGGGELLIKASSSDPTAVLTAYRKDGSKIGEVQNGGGSKYGGTVMPYQPSDPVACVIKSSSGGRRSVPSAPFQV